MEGLKTVSSSESEPGVVCAVIKLFISLKCPHGSGLPLLSWSGWTGDMVRISVESGGGDEEKSMLMCCTDCHRREMERGDFLSQLARRTFSCS